MARKVMERRVMAASNLAVELVNAGIAPIVLLSGCFGPVGCRCSGSLRAGLLNVSSP
jgi:hypothetical protein